MENYISAGHLTLPFGPYRGQSLLYVKENHPTYLDRMIANFTIPEWWRIAAAKLLMGERIPTSILPKPENVKVPNRNESGIFYISEKEIGIQATLTTTAEQEQFRTAVDGARYDMDAGYWRVPAAKAITAIKYFGGPSKIKVQPEVKNLCVRVKRQQEQLEVVRQQTDSELTIPNMLKSPFPSQRVDVEFGNALNGRFGIAHETGGGKTISAIAFAMYHKDKTLIVVPKKLILRWAKAIEEFTGQTATIWKTDKPPKNLKAQFHIINYELVEKYRFKLADQKFDLLVADEASYLKNYKSSRTKAIFGKWDEAKIYPGIKTKHAILLSATYLENNVSEIFTLCHYLHPELFSDPVAFQNRYGDGNIIPYQNLDELHERVRGLWIRKSLDEISGAMPKILRNMVWIELTDAQRERYRKAETEMFRKWGTVGSPSAAQIPMLRHALFPVKMKETIEFVEHTKRPFLIFTIHPDHAYKFEKHWGQRGRVITGQTKGKDAERALNDLINGEADYGLFTIGAAAKGLDGLQKRFADVFIVDRWWVPAAHEQAEGRARRTGQEQRVRSWYATVSDTYDEYLAEVVNTKQAHIDMVVDGKQRNQLLNTNLFSEFVHKLQQYRQLPELKWSKIDDTEVVG